MVKEIEEGVYLSKRDKLFNSKFEQGEFSSLSKFEHSMKPADTGYKNTELHEKPTPRYKKV
jgi:hypothetical protein